VDSPDSLDLCSRCTSILRVEVRANWEQSGRNFGRAEPPEPTVQAEMVREVPGENESVRAEGWLHVTVEPCGELGWFFA
jgi:hypothetical protein